MGNEGAVAPIVNVCTRLKLAVCLKPLLLPYQGNTPWYPFKMESVWTSEPIWTLGEEKNLLSVGNQTLIHRFCISPS